MATNTEIEMRWVDAWNDLLAIVGARRDVPCQLPDFQVVDVLACQAWLQDAVYAGDHVHVAAGWVGHRPGVVVTRMIAP